MSIVKKTYIDKIELLSTGAVGVRLCSDILEDGVVISTKFHRRLIESLPDNSNEPELIKRALDLAKCIKDIKEI